MEYSFFIKGSHRRTEVCREDILSAARDAAWLLNVADHEHLLWLPPLPPLRAAQRSEPTSIESLERNCDEATSPTIAFGVVGVACTYFSVFVERADHHWHSWQHSYESDQEARIRATLMICGAIEAISSAEALEQVRSHLLEMSGMPVEIMPPAFEVALQEVVSLQAIFFAPYERLAYSLFVCVLALTCLAVPAEQVALDQLRNALTPIEEQCSMQLRKIEAEQEPMDDGSPMQKEMMQ